MKEQEKQDRMRSFRAEYNLTQRQAAEKLGYNWYSWRDYERGHRKVPAHLVRHMAHYNALQRQIVGDS
jgi:predicted transcriptional regulator